MINLRMCFSGIQQGQQQTIRPQQQINTVPNVHLVPGQYPQINQKPYSREMSVQQVRLTVTYYFIELTKEMWF